MSAPPSAAVDDALSALAEASAWRRGALAFLMLVTQRTAYRAMMACTYSVFVVLCSRRWGKTRFAVLTVWIVALTQPGAILRYAAPTKNHGRQFVIPAMRWLTDLAPKRLRPRFISQDNTWIWPNGSVCHLGSCESDADVDAQVGTECHYAVVDEAGKIRSHLLRKLVRSILLPQFLTTRGKLCVLGTPPETPDHYFRDLVTEAMSRGTLVKHTIDACKHVDEQALAELVTELGGRDTTEARRELDCEFVTEKTRAIVPEFATHRASIVREVERPRNFDCYVSADMGYTDLSLAAFAYYHFELDAVVIEDELVRQREGNVAVARAIAAKERALWGTKRPLRRVADTQPQALADMYAGTATDEDGNPSDPIAFSFPSKHDRDAGINRLRAKLAEGKLIVDPRCVTIIAHLEYGIWNAHRTDFERTESHHWDGVPACSYLLRAVEWGRNPAPRFEPVNATWNDTGVAPAAAPAYLEQLRRGTTGPQTLSDFISKTRKR